jgi:hypothetical protein
MLRQGPLMKSWIVIAVFVCFWCDPALAQEALNITDTVVKIYTTHHRYNYNMPWQMKGQESRSGSGCIIKNRRILTSAHIVSDYAFIQVRRAGQTKKYTAVVEMVAHDCDLAVLRVADELNAGYQEQENEVISSVNGRTISSIQELVKVFEENKGRYSVIRDENDYMIILDRQKIDRYGPAILKKYRISSDRSTDLQP